MLAQAAATIAGAAQPGVAAALTSPLLRALLLPGGMNESNVQRVREHAWWHRIRPNRTDHLYVCICEDGRDKPLEGNDVLIKCLKMLLGGDDTMTVHTVGMDWENIGDHIARCDVWFMCGGQPENFHNLFITHGVAMGALADNFRAGGLLYIGSCGGAMIAGLYYRHAWTPMMNLIPRKHHS